MREIKFSEQAIKRMKELAKEYNVEVGCLLCMKDSGEIVCSDDYVIGSAEEIDPGKLLTLKCPAGSISIGYFHTHPQKRKAIPTAIDILIGARNLLPLVCVGTKYEICCVKIPDEIIELRRAENMYGKKVDALWKELLKKGYTPEQIEKDTLYQSLARKWFEYMKAFEQKAKEFGMRVESELVRPIFVIRNQYLGQASNNVEAIKKKIEDKIKQIENMRG